MAVKWISSEEQIADGFTKPLGRLKHEAFVRMLKMEKIEVVEGY